MMPDFGSLWFYFLNLIKNLLISCRFYLLLFLVSSDVEQPRFVLHKWESSDSPKGDSCETKFEEYKLSQSLSNGLRIRNMGKSENSGKCWFPTFTELVA